MAREVKIEPRWLSEKQTADYMGVGPDTVRRWGRDGTLDRHKLGGTSRRTWYDRHEIDALMEAGVQTHEPVQESA